MIVKENIGFQRGLDPKKAMGIGFFKFDVEYSGAFEENFLKDKSYAREWIYNGERILEVEGSVGSDYISMWIKLSGGNEFSVEANFRWKRSEKSAYLSIPSENIKDKDIGSEFFKFFYDENLNPDYSPLNPVLLAYESYFKEIEDEKEMQRSWEEANAEELDESQNFERRKDPKYSMEIGKRVLIEKWLKEYNLFEDSIINEDLTIDIPAKANLVVHLNKKGLENFPEYIQFRRTHGGFDISDNKFTSLRGCPTHVFETKNLRGSFKCFNNSLTSLEGSPKEVDGVYICYGNPGEFQREDVNAVCQVISKQIWGDDKAKVNESMNFQRIGDPLDTLNIGLHSKIVHWMETTIKTIMNEGEDYRINRDGTVDLLSDFNIVGLGMEKFPKFIIFNIAYDSFYAANNHFTSLRGFPKEIYGDLSIYGGPCKWKENEIRKYIKVHGTIWN